MNTKASFPLADLNSTFFESRGGVFPIGSPVVNSQVGQLSGFLYKAAYITGLKMQDEYDAYDTYKSYVPEQGPLGDNI